MIIEVAVNHQRAKPSIGIGWSFMETYFAQNIEISAYVSSVGDIFCENPTKILDFSKIDDNDVRCPDAETAEK